MCKACDKALQKKASPKKLSIERDFPTEVPKEFAYVPSHYRKEASERGFLIPDTTSDLDILNVWGWLVNVWAEELDIPKLLSIGAVAFGSDPDGRYYPVNREDQQLTWPKGMDPYDAQD